MSDAEVGTDELSVKVEALERAAEDAVRTKEDVEAKLRQAEEERNEAVREKEWVAEQALVHFTYVWRRPWVLR